MCTLIMALGLQLWSHSWTHLYFAEAKVLWDPSNLMRGKLYACFLYAFVTYGGEGVPNTFCIEPLCLLKAYVSWLGWIAGVMRLWT